MERPVRWIAARHLAVLVTGLLVAGLAGFAVAAIPGEDGRIKACYKKSGGALRVIGESAHCRSDEKRLYWNQRGPAGPGGPAPAWYADHDWAAEGMLTLTAVSPTTVLSLDLPALEEGQGYVGSATFMLVNEGPTDALVNCNLGNLIGHELFLPRDELTDPAGSGVWSSNTRVFTLTGASTLPTMALQCQINTWPDAPASDPPTVGVRRASIEAIFTQLEDQS